MSNLSTNKTKESFMKWSLHHGKVSLASMIIASGGVLVLAQGNQVRADDMSNQPASSVTTTSPSADATTEMSMEMSDMKVANQPTMTPDMPNTSETKPMEEMSEAMYSQPKASSDDMSTTKMTETTVTTPEAVKSAVEQAIHEDITVPKSYIQNANFPGSFTAGVNQVIPFEAFGGDGMLTRLLLKSSDGAAWSDNGTAMNPALLPLKNLSKGQYFYSLELTGSLQGKMDSDLLKALKAMTDETITGKILVYAAKDNMPDLSNIIASKMVTIHSNKEKMMEDNNTGKNMDNKMDDNNTGKNMNNKMDDNNTGKNMNNKMDDNNTGKNMDNKMDEQTMNKKNMPKKESMPSAQSNDDMSSKMMKTNQKSDMMDQGKKEMAKNNLPMTGESNRHLLTGFGLVTLLVAFGISLKSFLSKKKES
ncbi:SSURE domain-containing protein [Streptococcus thoraltensis]|uniref:SSURE domain-containing protein n=1 Tax=Streptococcus thoraltensis TaxID=55085 RepID=UPI000364588A|nr:fibronectin-binding SSURE repeat-containing protein [Streptococcus thoraltensis]MDY4761690.1 fibronectin-binding SSURE repeat-containing protein [Streptococcus thoraltensis]